MNSLKKAGNDSIRIRYYAGALIVVWSVIVFTSLAWNRSQQKQSTLSTARIQARVAHQKDVTYRHWNAVHGGVYVPVSGETISNPYLSTPERDITTPSGLPLTLVNPAYMTRQVHELAEKAYGIYGHITSLNPIRADNAPDPWESEALKAFESGTEEVSSIEEMGGKAYMRLMRPLLTETSCLKCHSAQGYKAGDVRGGISVSIPMAPLWAVERSRMLTLSLAHGLIWLIGLLGIGVGTRRLGHQMSKRRRAEEELNQTLAELISSNVNLEEKTTELEQANTQLQELDRLKSMFIASMSHELRTPLNSIIGFTGVILQGLAGPLNDKQTRQLGMVRDSADHLLRLINDILDISKIEAGEVDIVVDPFNMREVVKRVVRTVAPLTEKKGLMMKTEIGPGVGRIVSDQRRVQQVLINLVNNAVKFTERGEVLIECQLTDDWLVTRVVDTGIGIRPEDMGNLFKAFQQVDTGLARQYEGTGLGLSICEKLAELLGGTIRAESEWGVGSTFTFTLPINGGEAR
jgi:signal transduction histidine kinase